MFTLPKLDYDYAALEPHVDAKTMEIHHSKHHQTYVDKLNEALTKAPEWADKSIEDILTSLDKLPAEIRQSVINHGGGHFNHTLFWQMLTPGGSPLAESGELKKKLDDTFGSVEEFKAKFTEKALGVFGSGWAWLVLNQDGTLELSRTSFQNNPIMKSPDCKVLLGIDVWEHAYYLKHQNKRPDYVTAFWSVVNWKYMEGIFAK